MFWLTIEAAFEGAIVKIRNSASSVKVMAGKRMVVCPSVFFWFKSVPGSSVVYSNI